MQTRFNFLKSLDVDQEVIRRLSINLQNIVEGRSDVFRTPIWKSESPEQVLAEWDKVFQARSVQLADELVDLEISNRSKFGPRSLAKPWLDRKEGVLSYFEGEIPKDCTPLYSANPESRKLLERSGFLRPIEISKAVALLKNDTNSGLPYYIRKGLVKERVVSRFDELLHRKDPCIMFTRTQEQMKTRTVWGFPMADSLNEMMYYSPLLIIQKGKSWRSALRSPEQVDSAITKLIQNAIRNGKKLLSIDFSAYDTSIKSCLQKEAFAFIKANFQAKYSKEIDYIAQRFNQIGLLTPDGIKSGPHGVPSGSTFTNEVDSIVQYLIAKSSQQNIDDADMQIQGDDGAYGVSDPEALKQDFRDYGLTVNDDKSYVSDKYIVYLQNLYSTNYVRNGVIGGIYPTYRALNRILFQERWQDFEEYELKGSDFYNIRAISILENCRNHPLFEELVKFVAHGDKYGLRVSGDGIVKYVKMINEKSGAGDIIRNQYGDDVKGLKSFKTFQILSKL